MRRSIPYLLGGASLFRIFSSLGWPRAQWGCQLRPSPGPSQIIADTWEGDPPKTWGIFWLILSVSLAFQPNSLSANPTGETIVHGSADVIRDDPAHLTIDQHTDKAIIDWTSFSIGATESVTFSQPSSSSLAVNRVVGTESSSILGQLTANGRLMLINPNGILFGAGSRVDVNSLIATTIDISNERILANDFTFDQMSNPVATIVNRGTITAAEGGLVALVAPGVENTGVIQARLGTVSLASGHEFTLDLYGDGLVKLPVDAQTSQQLYGPDGNPLKGLVNNSGTIQADGGTVLLTAQTATNILDRVINMDGIVQANSVAEVNGQIVLSGGNVGVVEVAGTLKASGDDSDEMGGSIKVLGEKVGLFGDATVDASGDIGGGEVLIGGNFQGKGPEQNAKKIYIGQEATIDAHAKTSGDGGQVIVWSDEVTRYYGDIDLRGGFTKGSGGFAEVSGKQNLDFQGTADLTAANGDLGTLLLDPLNILVITGGTAAAADVDAFADNPGSSLTIAPATLDAVAGNVTLQATDSITFINDLTLNTGGATLTAQAQNNVNVNANITTTGGAITLSADDDASGAGNLTLAAGVTVNSGGANISMKAFDMTINGTSSVNSGAGTTTLLAAVGGTDVGGTSSNLNLSNAELDRITAGVLKIGDATSGAITISSDITPANTTTLHLQSGSTITGTAGGIIETNLAISAGGTVNFTDATTDVDNLAVSAAGQTVTFVDSDDLNINTVNSVTGVTTETLNLTTGGALTDSQAIIATNLSITNTAADTTLDVATNDVDNLAVSASGRTVTFRDADDLDIDTVSGIVGVTAATLNLTTGGALTDTQAITVPGVTTITAGADNDVTLDVATNDFGTVAVASGRNVSIVDQNALALGASTISGTLGVQAEGVTVTGNVTTAGATTIDADLDNNGVGDFTINGGATLNTTNMALSITANDMILTGNFNTGTAATSLLVSDGGTIGLGATAGNFTISGTELVNITSTGLTIGDATSGNITVDGITAAQSNNIAGTVTLNATGNGRSVTFANTGSTFNALSVNADDGIAVNARLTTDVGALALEGDADNNNDAGPDNIAIQADVTSADAFTFDATTGGITLAANSIWTAGGLVAINDVVNGNFNLTVNAGAANIGFNGIVGGVTPLNSLILSGGELTGALNSTALQVSGTKAVLTGTVNGLTGQLAANAVTFTGPVGAGPYTMNGFTFQAAASASASSVAQTSALTSAQQRAVTIPPAIINTQVRQTLLGTASPSLPFNTSSGSSTPQEALSQELLTEYLEPNIFQNNFQLVALSEETKIAFSKELDFLGDFWSSPEQEDLWYPVRFPVLVQEDEQKPDYHQAHQVK
jgi:filamentous hemagglutinin family protein